MVVTEADRAFKLLRGNRSFLRFTKGLSARKKNIETLNELISKINIYKMSLAEFEQIFGKNEVLRLMYLLQHYDGVWFGLCPHFKIWKNRNGWQFRCYFYKGPLNVNCYGDSNRCRSIKIGITYPVDENIVSKIKSFEFIVPVDVEYIRDVNNMSSKKIYNILIVGNLPPEEILLRSRCVITYTASIRRFPLDKFQYYNTFLIRLGEVNAIGNSEYCKSELLTRKKENEVIKILDRLINKKGGT